MHTAHPLNSFLRLIVCKIYSSPKRNLSEEVFGILEFNCSEFRDILLWISGFNLGIRIASRLQHQVLPINLSVKHFGGVWIKIFLIHQGSIFTLSLIVLFLSCVDKNWLLDGEGGRTLFSTGYWDIF